MYAPSAVVHGERADDALGDPVRAVGRHGHRDPVALRRAEHPVVHVVDGRLGRAGRRAGAPGLDDGGAALLDRGQEVALEPRGVVDDREACSPRIRALKMSGYCVAEWLPQMVTWLTSATGTPALIASWPAARLWSRRVRALKRSRGDVGGVAQGDEGVGVGRVARDQHLDVVRGVVVQRAALRLEDGAVGLEQVAALHALAAGRAPTRKARFTPSKTRLGSSPITTESSSG